MDILPLLFKNWSLNQLSGQSSAFSFMAGNDADKPNPEKVERLTDLIDFYATLP